MKHECSIVRDLLPLYHEGLVSGETEEFVKEHLAHCAACTAAAAADAAPPLPTEKGEDPMDENVLRTLRLLRKKFRRRLCRVAAVIAAIVLAVTILLQLFPVYRVLEIGPNVMGSYYSAQEIAMALFIGSSADRAEAQSVLRLADEAFNDTRHTHAENEAAYGLLARYAAATDSYGGDASYNTHSLELWSAHLRENEGWLWVYYSSETFDHDGDTLCGSWRIPSLWRVERGSDGWVVTAIKEHA